VRVWETCLDDVNFNFHCGSASVDSASHPCTQHQLQLLPNNASGNATATMVLALLARLTAPPLQNLTIRRPTPSTISFTVSTRPAPSSLTAWLGYYIGLLLRLVLCIAVLSLLWTKWRVSQGLGTDVLLWVFGGPLTLTILKSVGSVAWVYVAPGALIVLLLILRRGHTGTSALLFVKSLQVD
jgi:phosphatidylinositol glycan class H protein